MAICVLFGRNEVILRKYHQALADQIGLPLRGSGQLVERVARSAARFGPGAGVAGPPRRAERYGLGTGGPRFRSNAPVAPAVDSFPDDPARLP